VLEPESLAIDEALRGVSGFVGVGGDLEGLLVVAFGEGGWDGCAEHASPEGYAGGTVPFLVSKPRMGVGRGEPKGLLFLPSFDFRMPTESSGTADTCN